jgi:hypothetical protein
MVGSPFTNHALILVLISTVALPVRFALKERYAEERRRIETKGQQQRARELAARWNSLCYTKAEAGKLSDALLAKTNWASLKLSDLQSTKLGRSFGELFDYLQNPNVESYYRLKTEGFRFEFELSTNASRVLRSKRQEIDPIEKRQPKEAVQSLWDVIDKAAAALGYAMQILCAAPEAHRLVNHPDLWASDDEERFREASPHRTPWTWRHPLGTDAIEIRPAIIHLPHSKESLMRAQQAIR